MPVHACNALIKEYKGYQGQDPNFARFIFIGIDANFSPCICVSKIFKEVLEYLDDGVEYWKREKPQFPRYRHHPFLSPDYERGPGHKYHYSFSKMLSLSKITKEYAADKISFVELFPFPTYGRFQNDNQFIQTFNLDLCKSKAHLNKIDDWINFSENLKKIFIPISVLNKMCKVREQHGCFDWLPSEWRSANDNPGMFRPNTLYHSQALTKNSVSLYVITHFANAISDKHLLDIGTLIGSNSYQSSLIR